MRDIRSRRRVAAYTAIATFHKVVRRSFRVYPAVKCPYLWRTKSIFTASYTKTRRSYFRAFVLPYYPLICAAVVKRGPLLATRLRKVCGIHEDRRVLSFFRLLFRIVRLLACVQAASGTEHQSAHYLGAALLLPALRRKVPMRHYTARRTPGLSGRTVSASVTTGIRPQLEHAPQALARAWDRQSFCTLALGSRLALPLSHELMLPGPACLRLPLCLACIAGRSRAAGRQGCKAVDLMMGWIRCCTRTWVLLSGASSMLVD